MINEENAQGKGGRGGGPNLIKLHPSVPRPSLDPLIIWPRVMETRCCAQCTPHLRPPAIQLCKWIIQSLVSDKTHLQIELYIKSVMMSTSLHSEWF